MKRILLLDISEKLLHKVVRFGLISIILIITALVFASKFKLVAEVISGNDNRANAYPVTVLNTIYIGNNTGYTVESGEGLLNSVISTAWVAVTLSGPYFVEFCTPPNSYVTLYDWGGPPAVGLQDVCPFSQVGWSFSYYPEDPPRTYYFQIGTVSGTGSEGEYQVIIRDSNDPMTPTPDLTTSPSPTPTLTTTYTPTPTLSPTLTLTLTPMLTLTFTPTLTPMLTPTLTPTLTLTLTPTLTPVLTPTSTPTSTPTLTLTLTPTNIPTLTPTHIPTLTPTIVPAATHIPTPTIHLTHTPIPILTVRPTHTITPTLSPTPIITVLPKTGSCTISQPIIQTSEEGTNTSLYSLTFTTDNNQSLNCEVDYGNNSTTFGLSTVPEIIEGKFLAIIDISQFPADKSIYYKVKCSVLDKMCSYNGLLEINNTAPKTIINNDMLITIGEVLTDTVTIAKQAVESPTGKIFTFVPAVGAIASIAVAYPQSVTSLSNMITGFLWIFRPERKRRQGIVYGQDDKNPVPFAVIRLIDPSSNKVIKQTVSNLQGKYNMIIDPGVFILEVSHEFYAKYSSELKVQGPKPLLLAQNIGLAKGTVVNIGGVNFRMFLNKFSKALFIFGIVVTVFSLSVNFQPINIALLAVYLVQILIIYLQRDPRGWGVIFDTDTKAPLKGGFMSVLDPVEQRQTDVQITDLKGRFGFNLDNKKYLLHIYMPGYNVASVNQNIESIKLASGEAVLIVNPKDIENLGIGMKRM